MNKDIWSKILNIVITVLTAIATTFGVTSCMGALFSAFIPPHALRVPLNVLYLPAIKNKDK